MRLLLSGHGQAIVGLFARLFCRTMGLSGAEALSGGTIRYNIETKVERVKRDREADRTAKAKRAEQRDKAEALEDTLDVDIFSPPRQDWLDGTDGYFRRADPGPVGARLAVEQNLVFQPVEQRLHVPDLVGRGESNGRRRFAPGVLGHVEQAVDLVSELIDGRPIAIWNDCHKVHLQMKFRKSAPGRTVAILGEVAARTQLLRIRPADPLPELPALTEMWDNEVDPHSPDEVAAALERMRGAERKLTEYRRALHERIDEATGELIVRYREDPSAALSALPEV